MSEADKLVDLKVGPIHLNGPATKAVFDLIHSLDHFLGDAMDLLRSRTKESDARAANLRIQTANLSGETETLKRENETFKRKIGVMEDHDRRLLRRIEKLESIVTPKQKSEMQETRELIREHNKNDTPEQMNGVKGLDKLKGLNGHSHEEARPSEEGGQESSPS
jgi:hypothetical protein